MIEAKIRFYGRVQGVFFRATARQIARGLGIKGTVRNLQDGSVELIAQGSETQIEALVSDLERRFTLDPDTPYTLDPQPLSEPLADFRILH